MHPVKDAENYEEINELWWAIDSLALEKEREGESVRNGLNRYEEWIL